VVEACKAQCSVTFVGRIGAYGIAAHRRLSVVELMSMQRLGERERLLNQSRMVWFSMEMRDAVIWVKYMRWEAISRLVTG
jgi:hypothetical protein